MSISTLIGVVSLLSVASPQAKPDALAQRCATAIGSAADGQSARIAQGMAQVSALWRSTDGDIVAFCKAQFVTTDKDRAATFLRFEAAMEQVDGHFLEIGRELRRATDLDVGPLLPVDTLFSELDASAHLTDDMFSSKLAFVVLLNFPLTTLSQRLAEGPHWSREQWAQARLTNRFARRIPAEVAQQAAQANAKADLYISEYNLWMHHITDAAGARLFPSGKRLISHWNLRDEIKAQYAAGEQGANRQRVIVKLMERIVDQSIPACVINNPHVDYNPFTNSVTATPASELEADAPTTSIKLSNAPEGDARYAHLLEQFAAAKRADAYSPSAPNAVQRSFELGREIPQARVQQLFVEVLSSPLVPRVAQVIAAQLGRPLEPQDLWFDGFKPRSAISEDKLDALTQKKYPTADAYKRDIPRLLADLGFTKERASYLAGHIIVDPARGAGHALQSARRGDDPHLRTRVLPTGMNYKGYNIAIHEMGHNVEQIFSLYNVDHTLLQGVPNNAFTEAIAFVFQARDLELLGIKSPDAIKAKQLSVLNDFWMTWEIAGVALVDVGVWEWMYSHPTAKPKDLKAATVQIAEGIWDKYYRPVLGRGAVKPGDQSRTPLLGIYSHMIAYPLYLSDYPLGHLIAFQIEEQVARAASKGVTLGAEIERMATLGSIAPDLWMVAASGSPISTSPLLSATEAALKP